MSNVQIKIAGRSYTVSCAEGEESHITSLGQKIDRKLADLDNMAGQSETTLLLYAALLMADENHEATVREDDIEDIVAQSLENIAEKLESVASQLETDANSP